MKAIRLHSRSDLDQFVYEEAPQPQPGAGEVLIRVHATSVMWQEPTWSETWETPDGIKRQYPIPGHDVSGEVIAVGSGVTEVGVGEAVYALTQFWRDGAAAEYTVARACDVAPKPRTLDHIRAAGVPLVALTAWQGLFEHGKLARGQSILIHGAAGGVGSMAVQLAKWAGATVIATASARHHAFLRSLGADEIIDYTTARFEEVVHDVDMVLDTIGGETAAHSWHVLKKGGLLLSVFHPLSQEQATAFGVRTFFFVVEPNREQLIQIGNLIDAGQLQPIIEQVFPLTEARQAFEQALQGHTRGKLVLSVESEEGGR